jgi:PAS domain-containing protein
MVRFSGISDLATPPGQAVRGIDVNVRRLIDALPAMIWGCRHDGRYTDVNLAWLAFTGRSIDEQFGTGWLAAGSALQPGNWEAI